MPLRLRRKSRNKGPRLRSLSRSQVPQVLPYLAKALNWPRISRTVVAAAMMTTKGETRVTYS